MIHRDTEHALTQAPAGCQQHPTPSIERNRCLSAAPPPLGRMVHWAVVKQRAAGEPPHTRVLLGVGAAAAGGEEEEEGPVEGAVRCELIVEQVRGVRRRQCVCERLKGLTGWLQPHQPCLCCDMSCHVVLCYVVCVEQVQQVSLTGAAAAEWGPAAYESTLQLVTGRTHQIRAQVCSVSMLSVAVWGKMAGAALVVCVHLLSCRALKLC